MSSTSFKQYCKRTTRMFLIGFVALMVGLSISASAQQPADVRPVDINKLRALGKPIDVNKLRAMGKAPQLSAADKMIRLKKEPSVGSDAHSKTLWKPVFTLTPRNSYFAPTRSYWYFSSPAVFTPHLYDDEGVALFVNALPDDDTGHQMVLLFNGLPNTTYGVDITLGIGGNPGINTFKVGYVADGAPPVAADGKTSLSPKIIKVGAGPYEHLSFDLVASKSGEYQVVVYCTQMTSWWYFKSLEMGALQ